MSNLLTVILKKQSLIILILLLSNLIFFSSIVLAERATISEMDNVCQNWLQLNTTIDQSWREINNPEIIDIENIEDGDLLLGRIYNLSPDGFVVVPVLKEMPPILAYSDKYSLDEKQEQGMRALIGEVLYDRASLFIETYGDIKATMPANGEVILGRENRNLWDRYSLDQKEFALELKSGLLTVRSESVGPLLSTAWHQGAPYNMYCPLGYGDRQCVVGCVATAAAQIIYYWQWPNEGTGSSSFYWGGDNSCDTTTPGEILSVDYSDQYIYNTDPENLAELNYEVGVGFRMSYGVCGSGAYVENAMTVFPQYYKYKPSISMRSRASYASGDDWYYTIKDEIDGGRPMQYRINLHSIVCDGYREVGGIKYYHMNYGWGGGANTWFAIDDVYCPWEGCSHLNEFYIYNIEPCWVWPSSDATFGAVPFNVNLTSETEYEVDNWNWDFGDGSTISGDYPAAQHTYNSPGIYDLTVEIEADGETYSATRPEHIIVVADTISAGTVFGEIGDVIEIPIFTNNTIPLDKIVIPVTYSGDIRLA
ncbi:MAG: PKD domain-containing protein, partial [candidate division Zixibacteria bacterium]|nr:PKD domain-containing protein [candidate division Zixibacteria bacterium]